MKRRSQLMLLIFLLLCTYSNLKAQNPGGTPPQNNLTKQDTTKNPCAKCEEIKDRTNNRQPSINNQKITRNNTYVIEYDFKTKTYKKNNVTPWIHQPVVFKIININRLSYNINISSRDSTLDLEEKTTNVDQVKPPEINAEKATEAAKDVIQPATSLIGVKDLKGEDGKKIENLLLLQTQISKLEHKKKIKEKDIADLKKQLDTLSQQNISYSIKPDSNLNGIVTEDYSTRMQINNTISKRLEKESVEISKDLVKIVNEIKNLQSKKDEEQDQKKQNTAKAMVNYNDNVEALKKIYENVRTTYKIIWDISRNYENLVNLASNPLLNHELDAKQKEVLETCQNNITKNANAASDFYSAAEDFRNNYNNLSTSDLEDHIESSIESRLQKYPDAMNAKVDQMTNVFKNKNANRLISKSKELLTLLQNKETFIKASAPIQPSKDMVIFDIKITSKFDSLPFHDAKKFTYRDFVRGGLRYDFSTGLVFSLGVGDRSYSKSAVSDSTFKIIRNQRRNVYLPSIAGMFHASLRTWRTTTIGFTLGASINTNELSLNSLFPGLSLMVGKSEKWILTLGPALQSVDYLSSPYSEGQNYPNSTFSSDVVPVEKTFRVGGFIGISYNLTKKQKANFTIKKD
ncbi:hypothetical protein ACSBL2_16765 [Pedobacter sp. AW31-3R]|uniref:hypothetical protein n=1 Tax=Pedobacter sp. AW31-3R TaxID=3445781 RepID=UPI003FA07401